MVAIYVLMVVLLALCLPMSVVRASSPYRSWRWEATPNSRLPGHVIETKMMTSILSCLSLCAHSPFCWTVNHRALDNTCELNDADDRWSDVTSVLPDAQFTFYKKSIPRDVKDLDVALQTTMLPCHPSHILLDGWCHEAVTDVSVNVTEAKTLCDHRFGRLAVLDTPALEGILDLLPQWYSFWIDIVRRTDGQMVWGATGTLCTLSQPPWNAMQPDNYPTGVAPEDCGSIEVLNGQYGFNDVPCIITFNYICQYAPWTYLA